MEQISLLQLTLLLVGVCSGVQIARKRHLALCQPVMEMVSSIPPESPLNLRSLNRNLLKLQDSCTIKHAAPISRLIPEQTTAYHSAAKRLLASLKRKSTFLIEDESIKNR